MRGEPKTLPKLLSVVIPAYDEEMLIISTLQKVHEFLAGQTYDYEIIVVDDGSSDRTAQWARTWFESNPRGRVICLDANYGKGRAVKTGMLSAQGDLRLFMDADSSSDIEEIDKCFEKFANGYDVVIGSRVVRGARIVRRQSALRYVAGKFFRPFRRLLVLRGIGDTQCGFKCFRGHVADEVFSRVFSDGFVFDVEALSVAHWMNYRIAEVPVTWTNDPDSKLNTFTDSLRMFWGLFQIRYRQHKGQYARSGRR